MLCTVMSGHQTRPRTVCPADRSGYQQRALSWLVSGGEARSLTWRWQTVESSAVTAACFLSSCCNGVSLMECSSVPMVIPAASAALPASTPLTCAQIHKIHGRQPGVGMVAWATHQQPIRAVEAEEEPKPTLRSLEPLVNALAFELGQLRLKELFLPSLDVAGRLQRVLAQDLINRAAGVRARQAVPV